MQYKLETEVGMAVSAGDEKWSIDRLDGKNWMTWKFQMRHLLLASGRTERAGERRERENGESGRTVRARERSVRENGVSGRTE